MVDRRRTAINADAVAEWRDVIAAGVTRPYVTPAELTELLNCWEARAQADSAPVLDAAEALRLVRKIVWTLEHVGPIYPDGHRERELVNELLGAAAPPEGTP